MKKPKTRAAVDYFSVPRSEGRKMKQELPKIASNTRRVVHTSPLGMFSLNQKLNALILVKRTF
jgi:hypothetical protein